MKGCDLMNNERSLFPPLFRKVDTGGGSEIRAKIAEIDSEITDINSDITDIDSAITRLSNNVGNLSNLDTTDKSSLVGAVNEVASSGGGVTISTTETEIGTYNGKPLYAIMYPLNITEIRGNSVSTLKTDVNNVADVLDIFINYKLNSAGFNRKGIYRSLNLVVEGTTIYKASSSYDATLTDIAESNLIIIYTKTTD